MLKWLPQRLIRLYERLAAAGPYACRTRPPAPPAPPPALTGHDRQYRLEVIQDAFCRHRPPPRRLFRAAVDRRDPTSWCEERKRWTDPRKPRCHACEHAHTLHIAAGRGDAQAEQQLHILARRGAARLCAERRYYRWDRRWELAAIREERGRRAPEPVPEEFVSWIGRRARYTAGWHVIELRELERALLRDHARHIRFLTRQRRARLSRRPAATQAVVQAAPEMPAHLRDRAPAPRREASPAQPTPALPIPAQAHAQPTSATTPAPARAPAAHPTPKAEPQAAQPQPQPQPQHAATAAALHRLGSIFARAIILVSLSATIAAAAPAAVQAPAHHAAWCTHVVRNQPAPYSPAGPPAGGEQPLPACVVVRAPQGRSARRFPGRRASSPPHASARDPPAL